MFFDLFETLITEFADGRRMSNRKHDYEKLLGLTHEQFRREWTLRQDRRMNGAFASFPDVLRDIVVSNRSSVNEEAIEELFQARLEEKRLPFRQIRPDIIELLETVQGMGLKVGLISNCTSEEVGAWQDSELAPYFDDCVFSFEVHCSKPDAAIYALACSRLEVLPEESVFVGDGGSNELEGARRAGLHACHAFWFNTYIGSEFVKLASPSEVLNVLRACVIKAN
ncbi:HAD family hydrolase [Paenibacillus rhizovicinus]|uniref:HAD family hydrolase n=1 Tax=Paenibacillus rhizovicinus TaxID=2704463 RepID=UPI001CDCF350|nr:HAD family hydrolase [Paenibacillus rhizovicinus]